MRMLIVDDDETMCRGIQARIRKMNFPGLQAIDMAVSGEEALNYIQRHSVDVLLTDIQMVRMNGLELIEKAQQIQPSILSLILTAHASFPYAKQAIALGTVDFLLKPCSRQELYTAMEKLLSKVEKQKPAIAADRCDDPVLWAQTYVRNHLHNDINMAFLSNEMNLSYSYFSKLFKQQTGQTFSAYVIEEKMKEASRMVLAGKTTNEVAGNLGYLASQNLIRTFVNYWKCTPGEFRRKFFHPPDDADVDGPRASLGARKTANPDRQICP